MEHRDRDCPGRRSFGSFLSLQKEKNITPMKIGTTANGAPSAAHYLSFQREGTTSTLQTEQA